MSEIEKEDLYKATCTKCDFVTSVRSADSAEFAAEVHLLQDGYENHEVEVTKFTLISTDVSR